MNYQEILAGDIARYEQLKSKSSTTTIRNENVKTDVDPRRSKLIGEIVMAHFPELECFHPKLNKAANEKEFKLFGDFLTKISKYKPLQTAINQMVEDKLAEKKDESPEPECATCKSALFEGAGGEGA